MLFSNSRVHLQSSMHYCFAWQQTSAFYLIRTRIFNPPSAPHTEKSLWRSFCVSGETHVESLIGSSRFFCKSIRQFFVLDEAPSRWPFGAIWDPSMPHPRRKSGAPQAPPGTIQVPLGGPANPAARPHARPPSHPGSAWRLHFDKCVGCGVS